MKNSKFKRYLLATGVILAVPLIAMQFTDDVDWDLFDFVVMGALLLGAAALYEIIAARISKKHRLIAAIAVHLLFLLIWAEMAVGIFGSPVAGS